MPLSGALPFCAALALLVGLLQWLSRWLRLPPVSGPRQFRFSAGEVRIMAFVPWLVLLLCCLDELGEATGLNHVPSLATMLFSIGAVLTGVLAHVYEREYRVLTDDEAVTVEWPFYRNRVPFAAMQGGSIVVRRTRRRTVIEVRGHDDRRLLWISAGVEGSGELAELIRARAGLPKPPSRLWL